MPAVKPRVVVAEEIAEAGLAVLGEAAEVDGAVGLSRADLLTRLDGAAGLVVRSATRVDAELIAAAPSLRVVGRAGTGTDNIDLDAATRAGVLVVNAPDANALSAAEHTMALLLSLARRVPEGDRSVRSGGWERSRLGGVELAGKTLGIVGLGKIGRLVAERARAFGMVLLACDPFVSEQLAAAVGVELVSGLPELMARSDFVTLHVPLTEETRGLIGTGALEHARPGLRLVNTARGGVVDEEALAAALRSGRVAGAALDVFSTEPPAGSPLLTLPQVVVTPHLGASTAEAQVRAGVEVAAAVAAALRGELVPTAVNVELGDGMPDEWQPFLPVAEALGVTFIALARGLPAELRIGVEGELGGFSCRPLSLAALKGALRGVSERPVTFVNSLLLAEAHGVRLVERVGPGSGGYRSVVRLAGEVGGDTVSVAGTVLPRQGPALVEVLGREVEMALGEHLLLVLPEDLPVVIGRLGFFFGELGVSIDDLVVGRAGSAPTGVLGLALGRRLDDEEIAGLRSLPGVRRAWPVELA
jgi:D-3-phosphoglycerate dehydrogenase / 2-oxoglutarate reductase